MGLIKAIGGAIGGGIAVATFVAILTVLCLRSDKKLKEEYALKGKKATVKK